MTQIAAGAGLAVRTGLLPPGLTLQPRSKHKQPPRAASRTSVQEQSRILALAELQQFVRFHVKEEGAIVGWRRDVDRGLPKTLRVSSRVQDLLLKGADVSATEISLAEAQSNFRLSSYSQHGYAAGRGRRLDVGVGASRWPVRPAEKADL